MAHISSVLVQSLHQHLTDILPALFVAESWEPPAIKIGRLQRNPEKPPYWIMVHVGYPDSDNWQDAPAGERYVRINQVLYWYERGYMGPLGEIGGGRRWLRRVSVEISRFFTRTGENQTEAMDHAQIIRGWLESTVASWNVQGLVDDFGETANRAWIDRSFDDEKGGPANKFIWQGWLYITVETISANC